MFPAKRLNRADDMRLFRQDMPWPASHDTSKVSTSTTTAAASTKTCSGLNDFISFFFSRVSFIYQSSPDVAQLESFRQHAGWLQEFAMTEEPRD